MESERRDDEERRSGSDRRADAQHQGGFLQRRIVGPIRTLLKQGITPEKLSLCLALGAGYVTAGSLVLETVLRAARKDGSLSLA